MTTPKTPPKPASVPTGKTTGYTEKLQMPVNGPITSGYGPRSRPTKGASRDHKGIDLGVKQGTPVHAAASGTVTFAGTRSGYGNTVEIRHDDNTVTRYAHLSEIDVHVGQPIASGEIIAKSGGQKGTPGAGTSTGAHLHYEVLKNGVQVNPLSQTNTNVNAHARQKDGAQQQLKQEAHDREVVLNYNQDEIIQKLISGEHFKDNPANNFDNLTYHWRFFMTADTEVITANTTKSDTIASFYEKLNSYEQVTLAESGVTTYSVDEVTMEATVGTDFQTESTLFTSIEMKITEPNGVNFLDSLRNAAIQLGVRNYQKCFYYLELSFKGYDDNGEINLKPFDGVIPNGGRWIWTVNINDIQVNLSAGGGSYVLSMVPMTDSLLTGTYNLIPTSLKPSGSTVGAFFDDLCKQLNETWEKIKGDKGIIVYNVQFHPVKDLMTADEVRAMSITPNQQDLSPQQGFDFEAGTNTAYVNSGFTISRVLDSVMSACEQAQILVKDSAKGGSKDLNTTSKAPATYRQSIMWRMEPELHTPNYDPVYNEYYQHITLHIYGFRNHAAVLSPTDTTDDASTQKAILADMAKRNFLPKKYEYLFTGLNSEIIDIDLNFNLAWQVVLPTLANNTQEQVAPQAKVDPNQKRVAAIEANKDREQAAKEAQSTQKAGADLQVAAQDQNAIHKEKLEAEKALRSADTPENRERYKQAILKEQAADATRKKAAEVVHKKREELTRDRPPSLPQTNFGRTFGEDLTNQKYQFTDSQMKEAFPITVQTFDPTADSTAMPGQFHNGKSIYGAAWNQVYGPLAKQFFRISMTIKGDPYWIGAGSFEQAIVRKSETFSGDMPNTTEGPNCFLFKMRYPLGQDDNGDTILHTNETVTGVYQVNKITHRFIDGKFTQVLQAYRVPIIDLYKSLFDSLYPNKDQATPKSNQPTPGGN